MQIRNDPKYTLDINDTEKNALINTINYLVNSLEEELSTRTGFSLDDYKKFLDLFRAPNINSYHLNVYQLQMLHQAFNEILNGVFIDDFGNEIGLTLIEAEIFFKSLEKAIDEDVANNWS